VDAALARRARPSRRPVREHGGRRSRLRALRHLARATRRQRLEPRLPDQLRTGDRLRALPGALGPVAEPASARRRRRAALGRPAPDRGRPGPAAGRSAADQRADRPGGPLLRPAEPGRARHARGPLAAPGLGRTRVGQPVPGDRPGPVRLQPARGRLGPRDDAARAVRGPGGRGGLDGGDVGPLRPGGALAPGPRAAVLRPPGGRRRLRLIPSGCAPHSYPTATTPGRRPASPRGSGRRPGGPRTNPAAGPAAAPARHRCPAPSSSGCGSGSRTAG
jgi:hypothetical protein